MLPDLLETVTPAAAGATRRLTTKEKVKAELGITVTTYDTLIDQYIDEISNQAARFANLAADNAGAEPTFGAETLRATWYQTVEGERAGNLFLPWRPAWAVTSLTENGVTLTAGTDFRLKSDGELERLWGGFAGVWGGPPFWWSLYEIVVTFTAGWTLPTNVPPGLEARVIEQARLRYTTKARDLSLRSEAVPDVASRVYNVAGGSTIGTSGLIVSLESALASYQGPAL